ncbi:unnamed protein product [Linum trigynum]|uniref:Uncharacterized protein n=1 Tax=Linum trigynum TaxID=586398 RepID=A0AAV2G2W0_9ROSI
MGRTPCCDKDGVKKGAWSTEEDQILFDYINKHGHGSWRTLPKNAGLLRCGKSCRLRWTNYLRPDIKRGPFTSDEEATIVKLQGTLGNKWAAIASQMPGRTDNEIKNFWNTHLKKRLSTPLPLALPNINIKIEGDSSSPLSTTTRHMAQWESTRVEADARLSFSRPGQQQQQQHKFDQDYYLKLWNSDIGKSFRDINKVQKDGRGGGGGCESSTSQASSLTKLGPGSVDDDTLATTTTTTTKTCSAAAAIVKRSDSSKAIHHQHEVEGGLCYYYEGIEEETKPCRLDVMMMMMSSSDSITSTTNEFTNYSDTALKQLLDIPGGSGMDFLEDESDDFINFLDLRCV